MAAAGKRIQKLLLMKKDLKRASKNRQDKYFKKSSRGEDDGDTAGFPREPGMVFFFISLFWPSLKSQQETVQLVWESLTHKPKSALLPSTDAAEKGKIIARTHHVKLPQGCVSEVVAHLWVQCRHTWKGFWSLRLCGGQSSLWHEESRAKAIPTSQAHHNRGLGDLALYPLGLPDPMKTLWPKDFV